MLQNKNILFHDLGSLDYKVCWDLQERLFNQTIQIKTENRSKSEEAQTVTTNHLLFVEHPHVYTLGNKGKTDHLLLSDQQLEEVNATYYKINRGGDITYHGPGQLVAYPILDLDHFFTDIHLYLRNLEETIILTLAEYGIASGRSKGETGVWLDADNPLKARKICAMGVRCSRWVTMHGWGFNVNADLNYFNGIIPCGITDKSVTSLHKELGHEVDMPEIKHKLLRNFEKVFGATMTISKEPLSN